MQKKKEKFNTMSLFLSAREILMLQLEVDNFRDLWLNAKKTTESRLKGECSHNSMKVDPIYKQRDREGLRKFSLVFLFQSLDSFWSKRGNTKKTFRGFWRKKITPRHRLVSVRKKMK